MKQEDPDQAWKTLILETFEQHEGRYGYRRIHAELKAQGHKINHKKVQRISITGKN
ncbi:IS3 family transposase [Psychrobacillus sp. OK032]|uniref:IS3 family transposase n=1 Tax=Psychrobacillus sp. OK032 TaxID=1884358 RepID=UPI000AD95816|nr:IS3 family transposase [Psychrobacillus sp. OK032]